MKIAIISDTHGYIDQRILAYCAECDEVWHAGDFGDVQVLDELEKVTHVKGVWGNVDGNDIRNRTNLHQYFSCEGLKVWMTHIGGKPGKYSLEVQEQIEQYPADIFICGHSHILQVKKDRKNDWLFINPGAAGKLGFHKTRTMLTLEINDGTINHPQVIELGDRQVAS